MEIIKKSDVLGDVDTVIVLDFGGQYAHLIGRRIREQNVYSKVMPYDLEFDKISDLSKGEKIKGIILSGGPSSVYEDNAPQLDSRILELEIPKLGICYGHQLLAQMVGGKIERGEKGEYGIVYPEIIKQEGIFEGIGKELKGWTSHQDTVCELPSDFDKTARTKNCPIAAFEKNDRNIFGIQWHPEVTHSEKGDDILGNFLFEVCGCNPEWEMKGFVENSIRKIKEKIGNSRCIIGVSGGIDSTTAAVLASKALGENLTAVFVDHGLLRKKEAERVEEILDNYELNVLVVDEKEKFFGGLKGVVDPERKREIIGEHFIRIFERIAEREGADYLIQGTIYPDWIESGSETHSAKIKSHHNVGGIPSDVDFEGIIEPLRELYKDEVREVAESLGLPKEVVLRQPFPGPGLAVRIVGEVTPRKVEILQEADEILRDEAENSGLDEELWQYFSVLLSAKTTGVKGDDRDYGYIVGIRAVKSEEAMTAKFAKLPYDLLEKISNRTVNEIPEVTRVVYDVTHKPPATIEWE